MKRIFSFLFLFLVSASVLASCQYIESQHNHKYSKAWNITETEHWRQASCEHTELIVNKGEHTFDGGVVTKSPTEEDEGIYTYTCTVCKHTKTSPISRLPHTHKFDTEEWVFNQDCHWKNATCEHSSLTSPSEDHLMLGNVCITCGYMAESQNLAYQKLSNGTYEVVGRGSNTDSSLVIPATYNGIPVTSIGERAFVPANTITKRVVIPSSITTIKEGAFYESFNLEEVIFEGESSLTYIGDYAFYRCDVAFKSFTVPKSVTHIGEAVFQTCLALEEITVEEGNTAYKSIDGHLYTIDGTKLLQYALGNTATEFTVPDEVTSLGIGAFSSSPYLQKIFFNLESEMTSLPKEAFYYSPELREVALPAGITSISDNAFAFCQKLATLNIPEKLTYIGISAFEYCTALPEFELPATLTTIGSRAFAYCEGFTRFDIPNGVVYIGDEAMTGCINATEVTIPASVTSYGKKLFYGSSKLETVTVDPENPRLKSIGGHLYTKDGKTIIYYCVANPATSFEVPEGVTTVADYAFYVCNNLEAITLPNTLKTIGIDSFKLCENLRSINLPEGLTSVGKAAFMQCESLEEITIPSTLKTLTEDMLFGCDALTTVVIPSTVTRIEAYALAFLNLTSITFKSPNGWARHYTTDQGRFSEAIEAASLADPETAVKLITVTHCGDTWIRT